MAFGPGYLEAYELKSRIAINPRVILSRRAIQVADRAAAANPGSWQAQYLNRYLRRDDDGLVYVTFFDDPRHGFKSGHVIRPSGTEQNI